MTTRDGGRSSIVLRDKEKSSKLKFIYQLQITDMQNFLVSRRMKAYNNVYSILGFFTGFPLKRRRE